MLSTYWEYYMQKYIVYSRFVDKKNTNDKNSVAYFRDKMFVSILLLTVFFALPSYLLSFAYLLTTDNFTVFTSNTAAISVLIFITLSRSIYSGRNAGLKTVLVSAVFYIFLLMNLYFKWFFMPVVKDYDFVEMLIVVINNNLFAVLAVISVSFLIDQLDKALRKSNQLKVELLEEQKRIIEAKNKAEKSDELKTAFLANMSHEIRTPMYGILGCADFLKTYNENDKEYQEYVNVISHSGEQLISVMSDIIDVSKIDSKQVGLTISTFNVSDVINKVCEKLSPKAHQKNIQFIKNNFIEIQDSFIKSDNKKIEAILTYIIGNAIKYTRSGSVELLCERLDKKHLAFYIKDTGIGINKNDYSAIFDSFKQVDYKHNDALHGMGVGLTISKAYIEMLGGAIHLESKEGEGSTFWFTINVNLKQRVNK